MGQAADTDQRLPRETATRETDDAPWGARARSCTAIVKPRLERIATPSAWTFFVVVVFEILFMISPLALSFYAGYGPVLQGLDRWKWSAWLTQFFLPHFSETTSPLLNATHRLAWTLILGGAAVFLGAAIPLYWSKLRRRGAVTTGLYARVRDPQYTGLAVAGLGTLLLWPRFLSLVTYVAMLLAYTTLARLEEKRCLACLGESYRTYRARTGMLLPRAWATRIPRMLPPSGRERRLATWGLSAVLIALALVAASGIRDYALSNITALYTRNVAVLSPAVLDDDELQAAYRAARFDRRVQKALDAARPSRLIVYVVPHEWVLPDLPLEPIQTVGGGHPDPGTFDRRHYKVLFARPLTHAPRPEGRGIVKTAYGLDPIVVVKIDALAGTVTEIDTPQAHVVWGDIPTPLF